MPLNTFANRTSSLPLSELDANFTFVSDSTNLSFLQSGTGAVSRTVQAKERDIVSVKDFGAVGDGTTDDTAAIQAALNSFGTRGGQLFFPPLKFLIDSADLDVPSNVTIVGSSPQAGTNVQQIDNYVAGTVLVLNSNYTIDLQSNSSGIESCYIVRKGMNMTPANTAAIQAEVDAFAGNAVTISANDARCHQLCIVGFAKAIYHAGALPNSAYVRPRISYILFDCTNGIEINVSGDLGDIYYCHGFPIYSAFRTSATDATNRRTGIAFYAPDTYDWGNFTNCSFYGWATGFLINNCNNISFVNCGADGDQSLAGTIGFSITGTCQAMTMVSCKSTLETGYKFNFTGHCAMHACSAWGNDTMVNVVAGDVDSYGGYWHYLGSGAVQPWTVGAGAGYVTLNGDTFNNSAANYPADVFSVNASAQSKFRLFGVKYISCSTTQLDQVGSAWAAWTPSFTAGSGTLTTITTTTARYATVGKSVNARLYFTVTNNGTGATDIRVTAPLAVNGTAVGVGRNLTTGKMLQAQVVASGLNEFRIFNYDNTYPVATGDQVLLSVAYETP